MRSSEKRLAAAFLALALAAMLFLILRGWWVNYWILKEPRTETAEITEIVGRGKSVRYRYEVNGVKFTGRSPRDWHDARYRYAGIGEHCPVYYSAPRPWLSLLYRPDGVTEALPVVVFLLVIEVLAMHTMIAPSSSWSLQLGGPR